MWKRMNEKLRGSNGRKGFTLTEMLVTIAIIAITCAIAITSIVFISRNLKFKQRNEYAKTIFMAAQQNLSELRSDGSLGALQQSSESGGRKASGKLGFPAEDWSNEYYYTSSTDTDSTNALIYSMVLPANSVESALRNQQVIIEYNPYTGNVYSVFYCEDDDTDIVSLYEGKNLSREESERKNLMVGYYDGSGLASNELELEKTMADVVYTNGEEGIVTVRVPAPVPYYEDLPSFMEGLEVELTITGEISGETIIIPVKTAGLTDNCVPDTDGRTVLVSYVLDSLIDYGSFANLAVVPYTQSGVSRDGTNTHLTQIASESGFSILPGENVTIKAEVGFADSAIAVEIEPGILSGVNPLFEYMEPGSDDSKYILAVSNGRNLQNLNVIAPSVATSVETVVFTDDVYWNETVTYYNNKYNNGNTYTNTQEAPARCLPYFVPIFNDGLFGSSYFSTASTPVLQDTHDAHLENGVIVANDHADIVGNGHKTVGLVIDATKYEAQTAKAAGSYNMISEYYVTAESDQTVFYHFAGLFAYVNTNIDGLYVVNPMVKGYSYASSVDITTTTGTLLGTSGYNTLVTNCGAYIDKADDTYDASAMTGPQAYSAASDQTWYGVSGQGAVGGLTGYAKSHRTASGDLTDDTSELAFSNCFAAVPVSGDMRGSTTRNYGYTNGVGGFIGNSELTNFYNCYASGDVLATGCYAEKSTSQSTNPSFTIGGSGGIHGNNSSSGNRTLNSILYYSGERSMGAGGFVGTSHGTRYTNCFATGDVKATGSVNVGSGGFVGVMCYDEGFYYTVSGKQERITQLTVFDSCYSVGTAKINSSEQENFCGANARIYTYSSTFYPDYYALLAPYYNNYNRVPTYPLIEEGSTNNKYDAYYIYKDSYYLDKDWTSISVNDNSNQCANVATYDLLVNLYTYHRDTEWLEAMVETIGYYDYTSYNSTKDYYVAFSGKWEQYLVGEYKTQLREGFPTRYWGAATLARTHSYHMNGTYPFAMINGMDYYGDWPSRPLEGGIAYYEDYLYGSTDVRGFYFDDADNSSLLTADGMEGYTLVSDGYAILSANDTDNVTVTVNNTSYTLKSDNSYYKSDSDTTYTVFPMTKEVIDAARALVSENRFYVEIKVVITNEDRNKDTYTLFFNPNAAYTQINPSYGTEVTDPGSDIPDQIIIRTARQLAALSASSLGWTSDYRYVQELDIDFNTYTASSYGTSASAVVNEVRADSTIGNTATAFNSSYNGKNGYVDQSEIALYSGAKSGLFGVIGENGGIQNLIVSLEGASSGTAIGSSDDSVGIAAYVVNGTMTNVDLSPSGTVSVTAKTNAGLLAGIVNGTISDCDVLSDDTSAKLSVAAVNAGGAVGSIAANASANGCSASLNGMFTASGTNAGGFAGVSAGTVEDVTVSVSDMDASSCANAGGFAGLVSGGTVTSVTTNITDLSGGTYVGGIAGYAGDLDSDSKTGFASVSANIEGTLSGETAAGMIGFGVKVSVSNSTVEINGKVDGTADAAGAVGSISSTSTISGTTAVLNGTISGKTAVGYVNSLAGSVTAGKVYLNGGTISGSEDAAGFAHSVSGTVSTNSAVLVSSESTGKITSGGKAAGFAVNISGRVSSCRVTPATEESASAYLNNSNQNLVITGTSESASFAVEVTADGRITNCNALASISGGKASGFVSSNAGTVSQCIANITLPSGGYAFACGNTGKVSNSYCWYGDGSDQTDNITAPTSGSGYISCYLVDIDIADTETVQSVVLFDNSGSYSKMYASDLSGATSRLNGSDGKIWSSAGSQKAYPYSAHLSNASYPYPMLRRHPGDWVTAPQYAYGVLYYEKYSDGSWKYHVKELSDYNQTVDKTSLSMDASFDNGGTIMEAGYALFCRTGSDPFTSGYLGDQLTDTTIAAAINAKSGNTVNRYSVYALKESGKLDIGGTSVVTWYADAIGVKGTSEDPYQIRTPEQLAEIDECSSSYFLQTHNVTANSLTSVASFSGTYDGNGCKISASSATGAWITNLEKKGTLKNVDLTTAIDVKASDKTSYIIGGLVGTCSGTIDTCTVNAAISYTQASSDTAIIGGLAGKVEKGGTIQGSTDKYCKVTGSITLLSAGTVSTAGRDYIVGGAVGYDNGAAYQYIESGVTVDAAWKGANDISSSSDHAGQGPVGMFVGYVTGGSFDTCSSTDQSNVTYEFLGQIQTSSGTLGDSGSSTWFKHATNNAEKTYESTDITAVATANGFTALDDGYSYSGCAASLKACTFYYNSELCTQKIDATEYYYLGYTTAVAGGAFLTEAKGEVKYTPNNAVKYQDLYGYGTTNYQVTDYYYLDTDGEYVQVAVKVNGINSGEPGGKPSKKPGGDWNDNQTLEYTLVSAEDKDLEKVLVKLAQVSQNDIDNKVIVDEQGNVVTLYTMSVSLPADDYLITDTSGKYSFDGDNSAVEVRTDDSGNLTNQNSLKFWKWDGSKYMTNGGNWLYLRRSNNGSNRFVDTQQREVTISIKDSGFTIKGSNRYLTFSTGYNSSNFALSENAGLLKFWILQQVEDSYNCTFEYQKLGNAACYAVDSEGKELTFVTEEEPTDPTDPSDPTDSTNPSDPTDPTQTPTESEPAETTTPTETTDPTVPSEANDTNTVADETVGGGQETTGE